MNRIATVAAVLAVLGAPGAAAQSLAFGVHGVSTSYVEVNDRGKSKGFGIGAAVEMAFTRITIQANAYRASLQAADETMLESFVLLEADVRARYALSPTVAAEIGAGRRYVNPEFAAQDVGLFRVGVRVETRLTSVADIWGRGAYLVAPQFNGGGTAPFAFELGLGASLFNPNRSLRFGIWYEFQRLDRTANGLDAPIQLAIAKFGLVWHP